MEVESTVATTTADAFYVAAADVVNEPLCDEELKTGRNKRRRYILRVSIFFNLVLSFKFGGGVF